MNDDAFFDAMLGITPDMRSRQWPRSSASPRGECTAAVTHGNLLAIATVEISGDELRLCEHRSGFHELPDRDQDSLIQFSDDVAFSLRLWGVRHLLLRASPGAGPLLAKATVYKVEAVLQLIAGLQIEMVASQSVTSWLNRSDSALPVPSDARGSRQVTYMRNAIETAAYGLRDQRL